MDSIQNVQRQIRLAIFVVVFTLCLGIGGFMIIEDRDLLDAIWITVTTLSTIGYGDLKAETDAGRVFTIFLVFIGVGSFVYSLQVIAQLAVSPAWREKRHTARILRRISRMEDHFIISGSGELVQKTVHHLLRRSELRRRSLREQRLTPIRHFFDQLLGKHNPFHLAWTRKLIDNAYLLVTHPFDRDYRTLLDVAVVITRNKDLLQNLRNQDMLVIKGVPNNDKTLRRAGVDRARAIVIMQPDDTDTLLSVLTTSKFAQDVGNEDLHITAATTDEELMDKLYRMGANTVITPYFIGGQFLANATLRPAVNNYFFNVLFSYDSEVQTTTVHLWRNANWIGQTLADLDLRTHYNAHVIGIQKNDSTFNFAPHGSTVLNEGEVLIIVTPAEKIAVMRQDCGGDRPSHTDRDYWQRPTLRTILHTPQTAKRRSLIEAERAAGELTQHYVICGEGRVLESVVTRLNPDKPFVIISDDGGYVTELIKQGFRVVHGNPTDEETLRKAGIDDALALMVSLEDKADSVLAILTAREINPHLLITATAHSDSVIPKLHRAGADRVINPYNIAAHFVLLSTTRPIVGAYIHYVMFNPQAGIETTELYMQDNSPWIGQPLETLSLETTYQAGVIGLRLANGEYLYSPPKSHVLGKHEVLIVVTPMEFADELRNLAQGGRPNRIRVIRKPSLQS